MAVLWQYRAGMGNVMAGPFHRQYIPSRETVCMMSRKVDTGILYEMIATAYAFYRKWNSIQFKFFMISI